MKSPKRVIIESPEGTGVRQDVDNLTTSLAESATNVKKFGAKGDGVTDDYSAISTAINEAVSKGNGNVYLPPGTYLIGTKITIPSQPITFIGSGWSTEIKAKNTMTSVFYKPVGSVSGIKIQNMQINGNRFAQYCIQLEQCNLTEISGVHLKYFLHSGLYSNIDPAILSGAIQYETYFHHSKITGLDSSGVASDRPSYGIYLGDGATDSHFHDIVIRNVAVAHVYTKGGNNSFARIHNFGYPEPSFSAQYGFLLEEGRAYLNQIYNDGVPLGVKAKSGFFSVTNSVFYWRFDLTYPEKAGYCGIEVDATCTNYVITNNIFRGEVGNDVRLLGAKSGAVFGNTSVSVTNKIQQYHTGNVFFDGLVVNGYSTIGGKEILHKGNRPSKLVTINSGWTSYTYNFLSDEIQADANYMVHMSTDWNSGTRWITNQTANGFTMNWATAPSASQKIGFEIVHP